MSLKGISYLELCDHFVHQSGTICAILVECIVGNIPVKLFYGPVVEEMLFKSEVYRQKSDG